MTFSNMKKKKDHRANDFELQCLFHDNYLQFLFHDDYRLIVDLSVSSMMTFSNMNKMIHRANDFKMTVDYNARWLEITCSEAEDVLKKKMKRNQMQDWYKRRFYT